MPKLKLIYFDFHGGRGEPARLALSMRGIPFEDDRVSPQNAPFSAFQRLKSTARHLLSLMPSIVFFSRHE